MTVALRNRARRTGASRWLLCVAGITLPLLSIGGLTLAVKSRGRDPKAGGGSSPEVAAPAVATWQANADVVFRPIAGGLVRLTREGAEWRAGQRSDADFAGMVGKLLPEFRTGAGKVAALPALASAPRAKDLLHTAATLYVECLRVTEAAIGQQGDLRRQLDLIGQRLRILADRIYDRARVAVDPKALDQLIGSSVDLHLPEDVPNWVDTGLAAGPPLAPPPPPGAEVPREREATRPEQPEAGWRRAVEAAPIPPSTELAAAIAAGRPDTLSALAGRLDDAASALGNVPDPQGGRERAATIRLGLLVQADAARTAHAASLVGRDTDQGRRLLAVSRRLVLLGDGLWDPALPGRVSGLDPNLIGSASDTSEEPA